MCAGTITFKEKKPLYKGGQEVYFLVGLLVKKGIIYEVDNRSVHTNRVVYKVKVGGLSYWRNENLITLDLTIITDSIKRL